MFRLNEGRVAAFARRLVVYEYIEDEDRIVVVTIQDARSSTWGG